MDLGNLMELLIVAYLIALEVDFVYLQANHNLNA